MERINQLTALNQLLDIAKSNGYITFDDIMSCAENNSLSIGEFDWLSETIGSRNIIVYDQSPKPINDETDEYDDFAHIDFEQTFNEAIEICPQIRSLINDIRSIKPPQRGEVNRLKYQVVEGNVHARERLVEMYLRLAVRIAVSRAKIFNVDLSETVSDAFVGLLNAVDKYDPDYSGPFISFASMYMYQNITREQSTMNPNIYFPVHRKDWFFTMYPIMKEHGCIRCKKIFFCEKVVKMICNKIGCNHKKAYDVILASQPCLSLDDLIQQDIYSKAFSYSDDEMIETVDTEIRRIRILEALDVLDVRNKNILIERYGLKDHSEKTFEQVGQKFGVTRERIRQIEEHSFSKLRGNLWKTLDDWTPTVKKRKKKK